MLLNQTEAVYITCSSRRQGSLGTRLDGCEYGAP